MSNEAKKFDSSYIEKPPMHLLDKEALFETARVLGFGAFAKKQPDGTLGYGGDNWRGGGEYTLGSKRTLAAAVRHIYQYLDGEVIDDDSGLHHLGHALCEVMFALAADLRGKGDI